jgi:hypothetical protein
MAYSHDMGRTVVLIFWQTPGMEENKKEAWKPPSLSHASERILGYLVIGLEHVAELSCKLILPLLSLPSTARSKNELAHLHDVLTGSTRCLGLLEILPELLKRR